MENILNKIRYYDYHIYQFLHGAIHDRSWLNETYLFFAKYGIVLFAIAFIYLIYKRKIHAFICTFAAMGFAFAVDFIIMIFWKRPRPFIAHSNEIIAPITQGLRVDRVSFPSVHTYIAFAIATAVFLYGHKKLGTLLYILAIFIAVGRVGAGLHYPSDIIGGAMLGIASGIVAYLLIQHKHRKWE
jgi:undecaprenyl-diphosphatase